MVLPSKTINDPIHGHMAFDALYVSAIDTPQFQRLRDLKQTGAAYFVYPSATHTRFEHSLGVAHLAQSLITRLKQQQPELDISAKEIDCVTLAGLCHDLGHGPLSHIFDGLFIPRARPDLSWTHEDGSQMMLDAMITEASMDELSTDDVKLIKALITGEPLTSHRRFLFDIVANKRNSVDVDKFDYIPRDCYYTNFKSSYDPARLMTLCRVIDDELCYSAKEDHSIYNLFHTRYTLHKHIYSHKVARALDHMHADLFLAADEAMGISDAIHDPESYLNLTDAIVREIERSRNPQLQEAQRIAKKLRHRDLYRCADQLILPPQLQLYFRDEHRITPDDILRFQNMPGISLKPEDIIVDYSTLTYAMKNMNPVDQVSFYAKYAPDTKFKLEQQSVSLIAPQYYDETIVRVYARDATKAAGIQRAFRSFIEAKNEELPTDLIPQAPLLSGQSVEGYDRVESTQMSMAMPSQITLSSFVKQTPTSTPLGSPTKLSPSKNLTYPMDCPSVYASPMKKVKRSLFN